MLTLFFSIHEKHKVAKIWERGCRYLNISINSLRNKILSLKEILRKAPIDMLRIDETKLDETFPDAQFLIENYQFPPFRRDRNKKMVGKWFLFRRNCLLKD